MSVFVCVRLYVCACVYHVCVKERGSVVLQVMKGAGPDGRGQSLEAALVFRLHGNNRCLLGAQHLQGGKKKKKGAEATIRCRQLEETSERHPVVRVLHCSC